MEMYKYPKSPLGYEVGDDGIDSYGVNHNGFSTRDELEYQMARQNREQQLIQNYNNQGITENYPQYGTNFWGDNAYDNYGFGNSDISGNVQNVTDRLNDISGYNNTGGYNNRANYGATDYTINTENLIGKPSSYFQNNSASNTLGGNASNVFSDNANNFAENQNNDGWNYTTYLQKQQCIDSSGVQCTPQNNGNINMTSMHPDYSQPASLEFDGQNLVWLQNGQPVKYYPAQSGHNDYQSAKYTNVSNEGPIPEGDYLLNQGTGQDYEESLWYKINRNMWPRPIRKNWTVTPAGWGHQRIPIQPLPSTNTLGRHSMYVHGGDNGFGSAGCIDLERGMPNFYDDWLKYNGTLPLKVKYKKGW